MSLQSVRLFLSNIAHYENLHSETDVVTVVTVALVFALHRSESRPCDCSNSAPGWCGRVRCKSPALATWCRPLAPADRVRTRGTTGTVERGPMARGQRRQFDTLFRCKCTTHGIRRGKNMVGSSEGEERGEPMSVYHHEVQSPCDSAVMTAPIERGMPRAPCIRPLPMCRQIG